MDRTAHWEHIYRTQASDELGWYQAHPTLSLRLIKATGVGKTAHIINVGGGDSTLVDLLLDQGFEHVTVLDLSSAALERAKARLGDRARLVTWIEGDVTGFRSSQKYDLWHDRAVFHFLTDAEDRTKYRQAMNEAVSANGHVIIATFAPDAPPKCSGLEVVRYSPTSLSAAVGQGFELVETLDEVHVTPTGKAQPFIYCHFVRRMPCSPHT